jgi:hypothetical protein
MAIDIFSYSSKSIEETDALLIQLKANHPNIFSAKFHLSTAQVVNEISKEIALETGLEDARCVFLVRLLDKSSNGDLTQVAELLRSYFLNQIVMLFENERAL